MDFQNKSKILVSCPLKITPYLQQELIQLGFPVIEESHTSIETEGTLADTIKLNLNLRTANRVTFLIDQFSANSPDELYERIKTKIYWENILDTNGYFSIMSYAEHPSINNSMFVNQRCKDAIADYFLEKFNARPDSGPDKSKTVIYVYWKDNKVSVYLDTSGESLSKHGYRKIPFLAPMQESLASALILSSKWDKNSHFINPMCGSGTLAIEAALIAAERVNGLLRVNYGFMHIKGYDESVYLEERKKAKEKVKRKLSFKIIATDYDPKAIEAAKQNAMTAGVDHLIEFKVCDFSETEIPGGNGVVMLNPPYGDRIGEETELELIYTSIGDFFKKRCKGYTGYVFTGNPDLAKKIGLKTKRRIEFYNAKIECRLLEFELYEGSRKKLKIED
ncbi:MAG TPA: class I SAM-dependent RNA methyltransferase [Bacteroidia bacterium]|nr:class I SAM-dependent RNA methyltransferase [Bacteroidia bacterium]